MVTVLYHRPVCLHHTQSGAFACFLSFFGDRLRRRKKKKAGLRSAFFFRADTANINIGRSYVTVLYHGLMCVHHTQSGTFACAFDFCQSSLCLRAAASAKRCVFHESLNSLVKISLFAFASSYASQQRANRITRSSLEPLRPAFLCFTRGVSPLTTK